MSFLDVITLTAFCVVIFQGCYLIELIRKLRFKIRESNDHVEALARRIFYLEKTIERMGKEIN